ncbi:delta(3,5)-Delta(2,4)-dienoyl-CoA isomerase, mitochondrial [Anthonomus grandis grandis]|uniref:delta(3,5)-Delta(2,4)-dienoyl-CoA isomerase, mitochondrial n=1 Tax=Anthonomus grandis grandis TaxID=2921223 RepID=UPI002165224A|nr:delta(3,5)-Delta(2,4)-dienoyl-CoA isomerase, mitochondrial [Anthonomus grandis grandis]
MFSKIFLSKSAPLKNLLSASNTLNRNMSSTISTFKHLSVTMPKDYVFHVELNRPEKLNAFTYNLFCEVQQCFEELSDNEDCRVVVLSGAGRFFTAGLDLQDIAQNMMGRIGAIEGDLVRKAKLFMPVIRKYQASMSSLELCKKPVIAAIHSGCLGLGVDLVTAADMRLCTKEAYFEIKEIDIGLAADIGTLQRLPKVIGSDSLARELCYTCRKFPAPEALSSGLVSKVYDNKEEMIQGALGLAEQISKKTPVAVQATKASLVYSRDHTVQEGLDHIALLNQFLLQSEDLAQATMAQITKDPNVQFSKL